MKTTVLNMLKENRRTVVGTLCVIVIAGFSYSAGKRTGTAAGPAPEAVRSAGQSAGHEEHEGEVHEPTAKAADPKKPAPGEDKKPGRKPAAEPKQESPRNDDYDPEVEEDEIQIAHSREIVRETHAKSERPEDSRGPIRRFWDALTAAPVSVHGKVVRLHQSEEENRKLKLENAHLRVMLETQKFDCRVSEAKKHAEKVGNKLNAETGTRAGRTLASIHYQIPENQLPEQLHVLGISYLRAEDHERAATIFTFLTELEGDATYQTPENFLMAGVAWYRLENYRTAGDFFTRVLKDPSASPKAKTQARVWQALIAQKMKNHGEAQEWLRHTLESDPQSQEARWVSPGGQVRRPASKSEKSGAKEVAPGRAMEADEHATKH